MATVSFKRGLSSALSSLAISDGQVIVCEDTRELFIDSGTSRLRIGDFITVASIADLPSEGANETSLYLAVQQNILCRWNGTAWTQINPQSPDTGMTSVSLSGSGSKITDVSYDATSRTMTITLGSLTADDIPSVDHTKISDWDTELAKKQDSLTFDGTYNSSTNAVATVSTVSTAVSGKVSSVTAGDKSVTVGGTATEPTVAIRISPKSGNALSLSSTSGEEGLLVTIPSAEEYTIAKLDTASSGASTSYILKKGETQVGATIDVPKDMVVQSGTVETKTEAGAWGAAGTYLHLVLANAANQDIYINVSDLIEYVTSGSQQTDMVVISIDTDHKVTASITDGSITSAKLESTLQTAIGNAHTHTNKSAIDGITTEKINAWDAAEANVQANWSETDTTSDAYIQNKPTLGTIASKDSIAKTDLVQEVQTSLGHADDAYNALTWGTF